MIEWNVLHIAEGQFLTLVDTGRANQTGFQFQQEQLQRLLLLFPKTQRRQLARGGARHVVIGKGESETPGPIKGLNRRRNRLLQPSHIKPGPFEEVKVIGRMQTPGGCESLTGQNRIIAVQFTH